MMDQDDRQSESYRFGYDIGYQQGLADIKAEVMGWRTADQDKTSAYNRGVMDGFDQARACREELLAAFRAQEPTQDEPERE